MAYWLWCHIPMVMSLPVTSSCVVTKMPSGTNSDTNIKNESFSGFFTCGDHGRIEIDHLYSLCCSGWYCYLAQHSCQLARPQAPERRRTTCAVQDNSANHSSTDRIVVNSYNQQWPNWWCWENASDQINGLMRERRNSIVITPIKMLNAFNWE